MEFFNKGKFRKMTSLKVPTTFIFQHFYLFSFLRSERSSYPKKCTQAYKQKKKKQNHRKTIARCARNLKFIQTIDDKIPPMNIIYPNRVRVGNINENVSKRWPRQDAVARRPMSLHNLIIWNTIRAAINPRHVIISAVFPYTIRGISIIECRLTCTIWVYVNVTPTLTVLDV